MADDMGPHLAAPFPSGPYTVRPEWIDYNGHLNLAYYLVVLDWATDALWDAIGLGASLRERGFGTFAAESHIFYKSELVAGEWVTASSIVLGADSKRLHVAHELRRAADGSVSAQQEIMYLSVSLGTRRVTPFPPDVAEGLASAVRAHLALPRPDWVGRRIAMPSPA